MALLYSNYGEVDLQELFTDFHQNFHERTCLVSTNYAQLRQFKVSFFDDGLPHLLGLHYVIHQRAGSRIHRMIQNGEVTSSSIQRHSNFGQKDIKNRIMLYPFLYDVFFEKKIKVCVPTENMKPNPLRLSCVFTEKRNREEVVLGLRRDKIDGIFKPATLHMSKYMTYSKMKCSKITAIQWL